AASAFMQLPDVDQQRALQGAGTGVGRGDVMAAHRTIVAQMLLLRCAVFRRDPSNGMESERRSMICNVEVAVAL
ncbi:hypothetical protein, partial [Xanthomonas oryzae]